MERETRMFKPLLFFLWVFVVSVACSGTPNDLDEPFVRQCEESSYIGIECEVSRSDFPRPFRFGASTSAYQIEGGYDKDGRGPSVVDYYQSKNLNYNTQKVDVRMGVNSYYMYKEDIMDLSSVGFDSYHFSISWSRILPVGTVEGGVNEKGVAYYNQLINGLIEKGITPFVTLHHFDTPLALQQKYGAFLSHDIVNDFRAYSEVCFRAFGDRVKYWITINEPFIITVGYDVGPPPFYRCSDRSRCPEGNSSTEPYIVGHNLILAHGAAATLYKEKFQATQRGVIGISLVAAWYEAYSNSSVDREAVDRALDFQFGWFMGPFTFGEYPASMRNFVKERLPKFNDTEKNMVMGSADFVGLNYYHAYFAKNVHVDMSISYTNDTRIEKYAKDVNGVPVQDKVPRYLKDMLLYVKSKYRSLPMYITENGFGTICDEICNPTERTSTLHDPKRIDFIKRHLYSVKEAIKDGADVRGYFHWSLMDNIQGKHGHEWRMGLYFVDYMDNFKRYPKDSVQWLRNFLTGDSISKNISL